MSGKFVLDREEISSFVAQPIDTGEAGLSNCNINPVEHKSLGLNSDVSGHMSMA
jgi:hypothetical protein